MPERILRRSAELLDDSDDLVRRMDVQIFQQENGIDYSKSGWVPGDPIYTRPDERTTGDGQYIRQMFNLFPIAQVSARWEETDEMGEEVFECETYYMGRCVTCDVDWVGDDPCWMCGEKGKDWYAGGPSRQMDFVYDPRQPLDRFGFIAQPLTEAEEKRKYNELYGPPGAIVNPAANPGGANTCGSPICEVCNPRRRSEQAQRDQGRRAWLTVEQDQDARMQPDGVVRIVPVYHLQIAQEVVAGIPDHFLNTLRGAAEDTDYDIDRGYYHFRGLAKNVWEWFKDNAQRYYEEWSRHGERFGDVERRVRRRDAVIFGPGGIAEPGRPEDAIYEVTTVRRRNRFALPEERLADWERALLYGEDVDDILPSRRGSDGNRIV